MHWANFKSNTSLVKWSRVQGVQPKYFERLIDVYFACRIRDVYARFNQKLQFTTAAKRYRENQNKKHIELWKISLYILEKSLKTFVYYRHLEKMGKFQFRTK